MNYYFTLKNDDNIIKNFKTILETVAKISKVALVDFSLNGLFFRSYDEYFESIIHVEINEEFFEEFNPPIQLIQFKIDLNDLQKILSISKKKDEIKFSIDPELNFFKIDIISGTKGKNKNTKEFILTTLAYLPPLDDSEESDPYDIDIYELLQNSKTELVSNTLKELIKPVSLFAEEIKFNINENGIVLVAETDKGKDSKSEISKDETSFIKSIFFEEFELSREVEVEFQLKALKNLYSIDSIAEKTTILLSKDKPGLFIFKELTDSDSEEEFYWRVGIMIAPVTTTGEDGEEED